MQKIEFVDKRRAKWLKINYGQVEYRLQTGYQYDAIAQLNKYLDKVLKTKDGHVTVTYERPKGLDVGRYYSKGPGLQNVVREFRQTLCKEHYYDIDVVNCHPVLLTQYCKKNNIKCPNLQNYVKNRDKIFKDLIEETGLTKLEIKGQYLKIMFGGLINKEFEDIDQIINFYNEIQLIQKEVADKNERLYKLAKSRKNKQYNINGSTCSYLLQDIESKIALSADAFFTKNGYSCDVNTFDGLMVRNTKLITDKIIKTLNKYVADETGYNVQFMVKPMDEGFNIPQEELDEINIDEIVIEDDQEAAEYILKLLKETKKIIKSNNRYFIKQFENCNIYKEDKSKGAIETHNELIRLIMNLNICKVQKMKESEQIKTYSQNASGAKNILYTLFPQLEETKDFISKMFKSNLNKICFKNGYYDFSKKEFLSYDDDTYTLIYIDRDYKSARKKKNLEFIRKEILNKILWEEEQQKYFLNWCARGLAGKYTDKTWAVGLGARNSGKGVIIQLLHNTFQNYVGTFNADEIICNRISSDAALRKKWLLPFESTRLMFADEIKMADENNKEMKLDGVVIKSIASGGDEQTVRKVYGDEVKFTLQGRIMFMMNDLIKVEPNDATETLTLFNFNSKFKEELTENDKEISKIGQYKYFKSDSEIKNKIQTDEICDAFIHIIIDAYTEELMDKPIELIENAEDVNENDDQLKQLKDYFEFGPNVNGKETIKDITNIISDKIPTLSKAKTKQILRSHGVKLEKITKTIDGKTSRAYENIQIIQKKPIKSNKMF